MDIKLTPYASTHLAPFRALYEEAFPEGERKAFDYLLRKQAEGIYDLWVAEDAAHTFVGLLTAVTYRDFVLLDYLAVCPACRGRGVGHALLKAARELYANCHSFLEIEVPCDHAPNATQRLRRLAFYLDAGLVRTGVTAHLYGDRMELLAYPEDAPYITFDLYQEMLTATFPPDMIPTP